MMDDAVDDDHNVETMKWRKPMITGGNEKTRKSEHQRKGNE